MSEQHVAPGFDPDPDLEALQAVIMKMGGLVEVAIGDAARSLEMRDGDLARQVRENDRRIDQLEARLNEEAARILALRPHEGHDLRTILTFIKISADLERCGDFAKNIAKRNSVLVQMEPVGNAPKAIRRMARRVESMLKDALDAYVQQDSELAAIVRDRDAEVDQMYNSLFREFLTIMAAEPRNITACLHLHFIAKNIERIGDLVTSICEQVIYLVTGRLPAEDRPKGDRTSLMGGATGG